MPMYAVISDVAAMAAATTTKTVGQPLRIPSKRNDGANTLCAVAANVVDVDLAHP
jgi:hypothetical protein